MHRPLGPVKIQSPRSLVGLTPFFAVVCALATSLGPPTTDAQTLGADDEVQVNTSTSGWQRSPVVGMDDDGNFTVAWTDLSQDEVLIQQFDSNGSPVGSEILATDSAGFSSAVAVGATGDFLVTWARGSSVFASALHVERHAPGGRASGQPKHVSIQKRRIGGGNHQW